MVTRLPPQASALSWCSCQVKDSALFKHNISGGSVGLDVEGDILGMEVVGLLVVGFEVGLIVGAAVGDCVGVAVGLRVGFTVGLKVGDIVGGGDVGTEEGPLVGEDVGLNEGEAVGELVGDGQREVSIGSFPGPE